MIEESMEVDGRFSWLYLEIFVNLVRPIYEPFF